MKTSDIVAKLKSDKHISEEDYQKLSAHYATKHFSIHWEIKILLYLGVLLLSTGLGILIYKNIDTIGHSVIVSLIGLSCAGTFAYAYRHRNPFSWQETPYENPFVEYILLLSCLLFLSFEGYLQFQYQVFGNSYGLAALVPAMLFGWIAYRFDHKGILSMSITALAGWLGLTITPLELLQQNFGTDRLIYSGSVLGILLIMAGYFSDKRDWKKHFFFTYFNFGIHLAAIASLSAIFSFSFVKIVFYLLIAAICYVAYLYAKREQSFYFLLIAVVYGYITLTTALIQLIDYLDGFMNFDMAIVYLGLLYFIASCFGIILFFFNYKKILKG